MELAVFYLFFLTLRIDWVSITRNGIIPSPRAEKEKQYIK